MAAGDRNLRLKRAIVLAGAFSLAPAVVPPPAPADGAPGTLVFDGRLTFNGKPAPGQDVVVLAGPSLDTLAVCGRATSAGNGHYSVVIDPRHYCTDAGNDCGPVTYIFAWKGLRIGVASTHYKAEPTRADTMMLPLNIVIPNDLYTLDSASLDLNLNDTDKPLLVTRRYYGTVHVQGAAVSRGLKIEVKNQGHPCGRAVAFSGDFIVDIDPDGQCASRRSGSGWTPVTLNFFVEGREVWHTNVHIKLDVPQTLGRATATPVLAANWLVP